MHTAEKKQFMTMLVDTLAAYGKPLPDGALMVAWWSNLEPFPLHAVTMAFSEYRDENGEFSPVPAGIAKRCKLMDGRPSADEAWAIALTCRDESVTVVWTNEIAEAFGICKTVLDSGDEIGARMAFKEAYKRLLLAARTCNVPARWTVSMGWDKEKAKPVLENAVRAGYLAIESVPKLMLAGPTVEASDEKEIEATREKLKCIKEMVAGMRSASENARLAKEKQAEQEREALALAKQKAANRVNAYKIHMR